MSIDWKEKHEVLRAEDGGSYDNSGYLLLQEGDQFCIGSISHCSCTGTWPYDEEDNGGPGGGLTLGWEGSLEELRTLVEGNLDPDMPERQANKDDYQYNYLMYLYQQIREEILK